MSTTVKITNDTAGVMLGESTDDLVTAVQRALHAVVGVDTMDTDAPPVRLLALLGSYWSRPEDAAGPAEPDVLMRNAGGLPTAAVVAAAMGEAHRRGVAARGPEPLAEAIADLFHIVADDQKLTDEVLREVMRREPAVALRHPGLVSSDDEGLLLYRGTSYVRQRELVKAEQDAASLRGTLVNLRREVQEVRTARSAALNRATEREQGLRSERDAAQRVQEELHRQLVAEREARTGAEASLEGLLRERSTEGPRQLHLALGQLLATADQAEVTEALQLVSARHVGLLGALREHAARHVDAAGVAAVEGTDLDQLPRQAAQELGKYAEGVRRGTVDLWA